MVCFASVRNKILSEEWYRNKNSDEDKESERIMETSAKLILNDIRSKYYDTANYPAPNCFLHNVDDDKLRSLRLFLDVLIKSHKCSENSYVMWDKRITTLCHIIINSQ